MNMDMIMDTFKFWGKLLYYFLETSAYKIIPKRKKNVAGEIVLITGAGGALGRELAIKFANLGAILVLWDINTEGNMETCRLAKENGGVKVFSYTCDCSNRQEIYRVAEQVKKEVGHVTILINNAGIVTGKRFLDSPDHMVEKTFLVNALSHFWTYKAFLPAMINTNHGHLVCISSAAGLIGIPGLADYCGSKFAVFGFAESLFYELNNEKTNKIKTTIVCPYFLKTGMYEGCKCKRPFELELEFVAQSIVNAILEEQVYVLLPKFMYIAMFLKQIISVKMNLAIIYYLGVNNCMESFRGRATEKEVQTKKERKLQ